MNAFPKRLSQTFLVLSALFAIAFVIVLAIGKGAVAPHFLTGCFLSLALAAGLAKSLGKVAALGLVPIVFGPVMNIIASILTNWWRTHPAESQTSELND